MTCAYGVSVINMPKHLDRLAQPWSAFYGNLVTDATSGDLQQLFSNLQAQEEGKPRI